MNCMIFLYIRTYFLLKHPLPPERSVDISDDFAFASSPQCKGVQEFAPKCNDMSFKVRRKEL